MFNLIKIIWVDPTTTLGFLPAHPSLSLCFSELITNLFKRIDDKRKNYYLYNSWKQMIKFHTFSELMRKYDPGRLEMSNECLPIHWNQSIKNDFIRKSILLIPGFSPIDGWEKRLSINESILEIRYLNKEIDVRD